MQDPRVEAFLNKMGLKWKYMPAIPMDKFLQKEGLRNQARLAKALDRERVDDYALAMIDGAEFPAVVTEETTLGYGILGGNHRMAAAVVAEKKMFDAYVVNIGDEYIRQIVIRSLNRLEGAGETREEALAHAKYLVRRFNRSLREVAAAMGIGESLLSDNLRLDLGMERLSAMGLDPTKIARDSIVRLTAISNDPAMSAAADLAIKAKLAQASVSDLVKDVRTASSENDQIAVVARWRNEPEIARRIAETASGTRPSRSTARHAVFSPMSSLVKAIERYQTPDQMQMTSKEDIDRLEKMLETIAAGLRKIIREARTRSQVVSQGHPVRRPGAQPTGTGAEMQAIHPTRVSIQTSPPLARETGQA